MEFPGTTDPRRTQPRTTSRVTPLTAERWNSSCRARCLSRLGAKRASCSTAHGALARPHWLNYCLNCWKQHTAARGTWHWAWGKCLLPCPATLKQQCFAVVVDSAAQPSCRQSTTSTTACPCGTSPSTIILCWMRSATHRSVAGRSTRHDPLPTRPEHSSYSLNTASDSAYTTTSAQYHLPPKNP